MRAKACNRGLSARRQPDATFAAGRSVRFTIRLPGRALEGVAHPEHARRPIEITTKSFGIAPGVSRAHARGHRTSIAVRGAGSLWLAFYIARLTHRCSCQALQALRLGAWTI